MGDPKMRLFVVVVVADAVVVDTTIIKHPLNSIQETSISDDDGDGGRGRCVRHGRIGSV